MDSEHINELEVSDGIVNKVNEYYKTLQLESSLDYEGVNLLDYIKIVEDFFKFLSTINEKEFKILVDVEAYNTIIIALNTLNQVLQKLLSKNNSDSNLFYKYKSLISHEFSHAFASDISKNITFLTFDDESASDFGYTIESMQEYAKNALNFLEILKHDLLKPSPIIEAKKILGTLNLVRGNFEISFNQPDYLLNFEEFFIIRTLILNVLENSSLDKQITVDIEFIINESEGIKIIKVTDSISSEWNEEAEESLESGKRDFQNTSESYDVNSGGLRMVSYFSKGNIKLNENDPDSAHKSVEIRLPLSS